MWLFLSDNIPTLRDLLAHSIVWTTLSFLGILERKKRILQNLNLRHAARIRLLPWVGPQVDVDLDAAAVSVTDPVGGLQGEAGIPGVAFLFKRVGEAHELELVADAVTGDEIHHPPGFAL